jgi:general stress protein CsbA
MVAILATALLCGIVGFASQPFWVIAVVVLALGLGYVVANTRQNQMDVAARTKDDS